MLSNVATVENELRGRLIDMKDPMKLQHDDPLKPKDPDPKSKIF